MEYVRVILTGEVNYLNGFIKEWWRVGEEGEAPEIDEGMDIVLNVAEKHVKQLQGMATAFHLHTYILN